METPLPPIPRSGGRDPQPLRIDAYVTMYGHLSAWLHHDHIKLLQ